MPCRPFFVMGLLAALAAACASSQDQGPAVRVEPAFHAAATEQAATYLALARAETDPRENYLCRLPPEKCAENDWITATLCTIHAYKDQTLPAKTTLQAWGRTPCLARAAAHNLACQDNPNPDLDPRFYHDVVCSPDPSNRECPVTADCASDKGKTPTACRAVEYEGEALPSDQQFSAEGASLCEARNQLFQMACVNLLRPSAISSMHCAQPGSPACADGDDACQDMASFKAPPLF